ncbi:MAG: hypothetical protein P8016_15955 [Sedimentisphaerales bacterium]
MRFIKSLFLGMIAVMLLGLPPLYASDESMPSIIVKGTLSYKDGNPAQNREIYFFGVFYTSDGERLSAQTSIRNGHIANPFDVTDNEGLFEIKITSDFLKNTEFKKFSVGLIRGFGPGFTILRSQDGTAVTIDINPNTVATAQSDRIINLGRVKLNP